ncbi:uncharacterized protein LOC117172478 isoform X3 [Belonocnema kinseyi]|uniref:uncharacterized protein LOC117172478 isoform X3 n=1 Tax=Belonocnema kinseyi TaxID=2817044 RepID=UPI00143DD8BE|nr:uncharacterized protein LOC117172478 isoform X3 [Belonocnema kinseyi]
MSKPVRRGDISITPEMIRDIVEELQMKRLYVPSSLILNHLQSYYPTRNKTAEILKQELKNGLITAVSNGLIVNWGNDKYCLPTFRQEAMSEKSKFSAFHERYYYNVRD